ncbi:MAG: hypothetical protein NT075_13380 [Chloroflexi bacterium]|nr:hypothetical protein [Chloroflexota bacterium]
MYATSGTKASPTQAAKHNQKQRFLLALLIVFGLLSHLLRLRWQPLWWDEGYSVYFATEPLARMLWLTAHDIHPPLYYALLHGWLFLFQSAQPAVLRLFSVFVGTIALPLFAWLAHTFFPQRRHLPWLATLLLAINPMQLFYSQEVRMYELALLLSIASTAFFWKIIQHGECQETTPAAGVTPPNQRLGWHALNYPLLGYIITASLALYTLYYLALLLLAHFVWAGWHFRHHLRRLMPLLWADGAIALLYLPWVLYAAPKLILYVQSKVRSDNDTPLTILTYLTRHLMAFTAGHLIPANTQLYTVSIIALVTILPLLIATRKTPAKNRAPLSALLTFLWLPVAVGYLLNLRFPFFPEGGERLLLFVLPYFLLWLAGAIDICWQTWRIGQVALAGLLASALIGSWTFYTTPRYTADDYRPLIQQVVQQGTDHDTVLAIFPWQIGYWRAYAPSTGLHLSHGPAPELIAEGALAWGETVQQAIDGALARGTLWFPAPLSFGSTLPPQIDHYVARQAINLVNVWYNTTTRLYAWHRLPTAPRQMRTDDFGPVQLLGASVTPQQAASANQPLAITLAWQIVDQTQSLGVTVRLQDAKGQTWANRDYAPLGSLSSLTTTTQPVDLFGFVTPVGLPPGVYTVAVGVVDSTDQLLARRNVNNGSGAQDSGHLAPIGTVTITQPEEALPIFRLPIQTPLAQPLTHDGLALLGYAGYTTGDELLAGEAMDVKLFLQNQGPTPPTRQLYISLLDGQGKGVAGWAGWPLPDYPTSAWPVGALGQVPVSFYLPPDLTTSQYQLIAGFLDPATNTKSPAASLDRVQVRQRMASFTKPTMTHSLAAPVQFGTHVQLLGYDLVQEEQELALRLHWQVLQTLTPSHHIFVHLDSPDNQTLAQADSLPETATGPAPSGSWRPDEYFTTVQALHRPATTPPDAILHVGLYNPVTGQRLPASVNGAAIGDMATIALQP